MSQEIVITLLTEIRDELRLIRAGKKAPVVADDAELDSDYGDEIIKFEPKNWTGDLMTGKKMSETTPEFLDRLASSFDFFAGKNKASGEKANNGTPKHVYDERSAARARGWAARLRNGWTRPAPAQQTPAEAEAAGFGSF